MHADILHQRIDRTGAAVRAVEQVPALQKLHILCGRSPWSRSSRRPYRPTNESVTIQRIENILTAFGNTQHDLIFSIPRTKIVQAEGRTKFIRTPPRRSTSERKHAFAKNVPDAESIHAKPLPTAPSPKRSSSPTDDPDNPDNRSGLPCNSLRSLSFRRHPHPKPKKIITINKIYHPKRKYLFNETKICIYL